MTQRITPQVRAAARGRIAAGLAAAGLALLAGCASSLLPPAPPLPAQYTLDGAGDSAAPSSTRTPALGAPTLAVSAPRAAPGLDSRGIIYLRQPHAVEVYAQSQWVDTPAQMLAPLIVDALQRTGAFAAVLRAPSAASAELRLDTELLRLQQDFGVTPSRVHLSLRAVLVDTGSRRVLAWREFDASVAAPSEDAYGGVRAANQAARQLLIELATFTAQAAAKH